MDKEITEQDLIKEFMRVTNQELKEDELTVNQFVEFAEISRNRARYILAKYEQKGLLKSRKVNIDSSVVNAYSPKSSSWKDVISAIKQQE